jgi:hypothetical protein
MERGHVADSRGIFNARRLIPLGAGHSRAPQNSQIRMRPKNIVSNSVLKCDRVWIHPAVKLWI